LGQKEIHSGDLNMPSLIRFVVFVLFLGALGFGSMIGLTAFVEPEEKEVSVRIPTRDLLGQ